MKVEKYQRKINDVISKCPIEAGVEILVYNLLDEYVNEEKLSLVDINRICKGKDSRLTTEAGIPDIAVVSKDFRFAEIEQGNVYGLVEVKAAGVSVRKTEQSCGEAKKARHFIYTNGLVWKFYQNGENKDVFNLIEGKKKPHSKSPVVIDEVEFKKLQDYLLNVKWI